MACAAAPIAANPPRGWNSYDSFTWKVSEDEFLANCEAMSKTLKSSGYEYCVVDYLWFQDLDSKGGQGELKDRGEFKDQGELKDPITKLHIDGNGRLVPALDRWPSTKASDGSSIGFKPIADKVHAMGMKFGIHIMRGISATAVAAKSPILGTNATAADIGVTSELCPWWKGVMAVDLTHPAGQAYYDSIYQQYADWGVDFIKNDCVFGNQFVPDQIKAQSKSILKTKRPIVYSLSPGAGVQDHMEKPHNISGVVNMYRITGDDWDSWGALEGHFTVAAQVAAAGLIGAPGLNGKSWPDLDMLPLGVITTPNTPGTLPHKNTSLSPAMQRTQMTLWSIAKSPLMFGGVATQLDAFTTRLLGNKEVLALNSDSFFNHQVSREGGKTGKVVWVARRNDAGGTPDQQQPATYVALFNLDKKAADVSTTLDALGILDKKCNGVRNVWTGAKLPPAIGTVSAEVEPTGVVLLSLADCS
jgi:hypothetical protein